MAAVMMTARQAKVIAIWSAAGEGFVPLEVHDSAPSYLTEWVAGDVLVTQGDAYVQVSHSGIIRDRFPPLAGVTGRAPPRRDFSFVQPGAPVRAEITSSLASQLAAFGAGDEERELGEALLRVLARNDNPLLYDATVAIAPEPERASDPNAVASLRIPELDDSGDLFSIALADISPASSEP